MEKVLYLRVEVAAPEECDPMQTLSDAALWAECRLSHDDIEATRVTAYNCAQDIVLDEAEGVFGAQNSILPQESISSNYMGEEARQQFLVCLNSFLQDDATGQAYAVKRNEDLRLEMVALAGCAIEGIALHAQNDVDRLKSYSMIIIDSGNSHGDSWKAIFHPAECVLNFVREDNY